MKKYNAVGRFVEELVKEQCGVTGQVISIDDQIWVCFTNPSKDSSPVANLTEGDQLINDYAPAPPSKEAFIPSEIVREYALSEEMIATVLSRSSNAPVAARASTAGITSVS